jgi:hypothetical protein
VNESESKGKMKSKNNGLLNEPIQISSNKEKGNSDVPKTSVETTQPIQKYFIINYY